MNDALSDVKSPRVDNSMVYNISIDETGNAVVTTQKIAGGTGSGSDDSES